MLAFHVINRAILRDTVSRPGDAFFRLLPPAF
jgi:hypothetical protein